MKTSRLVWLSLVATSASVCLVSAAVGIELRMFWKVAVPGALFALGGWLVFFLPLVVWEGRTGHRFSPARMALLGCAVGALFPGFFLAINGAYFWEWHPGHPQSLALLAIPAASLAGWTFASLRIRLERAKPHFSAVHN